MNLEHMFLSTMIKESSEDALFEEALSIVSTEDLEKIAEGDSVTGHIMHGAKVLPLPLIGALAGGAYGALDDPGVDPDTGEKKGRFGNMLAGAAGGTLVGVGAKHVGNVARRLHGPTGDYLRAAQKEVADVETNLSRQRQSRSSIAKGARHAKRVGEAAAKAESSAPKSDPPSSQMELFKRASSVKLAGGEGNALKAVGEAAKTHLRTGADYLHNAGPAGVAAGAAVLNAARKFVFPDKDRDGNDKDSLGEAAKGALTGGLAGAAVGHGIKHLQPAIKGEQTLLENVSTLYNKHLAKYLEKGASVKVANLGAVAIGAGRMLAKGVASGGLRGVGMGALGGAATGALEGGLYRQTDPNTGRKQKMLSALAGGATRGAAGGVVSTVAGNYMNRPTLPRPAPTPQTAFQNHSGQI